MYYLVFGELKPRNLVASGFQILPKNWFLNANTSASTRVLNWFQYLQQCMYMTVPKSYKKSTHFNCFI